MIPLKARLQALYEGNTDQAHRFRYTLLAFDIATVAFVIATSFLPLSPWIVALDVALGLGVLADFLGRLMISRAPAREFLRLSTWTDVVAIVSFLAPMFVQGVGFLRILRTLRLLRTYQLLERLRHDSPFFRRNEEAILAATNLVVFVFVMTGVVYVTQVGSNPAIGSPVDALYFTVTSLTTTGYGDITLPGTSGRLISVFVMICGVTLFFRLAQVVFRPYKVRFPCPTCGLQRHEPDAVHCKACGTTLNIPDEGAY
ncbi:potassium channel family protein [Methylobacterium currus]|uniref:potassium channel family protein n=1 Tax=Methylobacterium currus TaxID=2051553 RepID=UPI001E36CF9D|nr:potassium channel family protein [Methylobacterium currus]UHC18942.1 potassium channel family protein [Methylobacterium currus]